MMGLMIARLPLYEDQRELGDSNPHYSPAKAQNVIRVLTFALSNIHRENQFFTDILSRQPYRAQEGRQKAWTARYVDYLRKVALESGHDLGEALVVLWAMEVAFLNAWNFAKSLRPVVSSVEQQTEHIQTCQELMTNWTMEEFNVLFFLCVCVIYLFLFCFLIDVFIMSSDEPPPAILLRWCKDRCGIRLSSTYFQAWHETHKHLTNTEAAYNELLQDFLRKDIAETSEPIITDDFGQSVVDIFPAAHHRPDGVVLQIQDTTDISNSAFSLLNNLKNSVPVRQTYVERSADDPVEFPRGMLRWTLTDGSKQIQAMEMETIPGLDLKTPFGCKLLIKNCQVKRGMLLLNKNNTKVLGGDVPELYGGNMMTELERRLKTKLGLSTDEQQQQQQRAPPRRTISSPELVDEIEDFDDDDIDYSALEAFENMNNDSTKMMVDSVVESIENHEPVPPSEPILDDPFGDFDDEDFMDFSLARASKRQQEEPPSPAKRIRNEPDSLTTGSSVAESTMTGTTMAESTMVESTMAETIATQEEQTTAGESQELSWIDDSVWDSMNELDKRQTIMEVDQDGKAHCSFEVLQKTLKAMEQPSYAGQVADTVFVKVKCIKLATLRMSTIHGFYLEVEIGDPEEQVQGTIKVVFNNEVMLYIREREMRPKYSLASC
ncbi:MAG: hypothetical protein EXX96DRAFT_476313 [Benjaminiella poitrasii]|nr:MAG: hypothetical protein EXX96DRAFT_476313 [Benjaminiella poitrasii]